MITIHHYEGITGKHIDDVTRNLTSRLWEEVGFDRVDYFDVIVFQQGGTEVHIFVDDAGICGRVKEERF